MKKYGWKKELVESINAIDHLPDHLDIEKNLLEDLKKPANTFSLRSTVSFLKRAKGKGIKALVKQILPDKQELLKQKDYTEDPLGEAIKSPTLGVIHKYNNRVLLVSSGACAINCRYCFRRHYPYSSNTPSSSQWQKTLKYIENNKSIREVILSGGDPLMLKDKKLKFLIKNIENIKHIVCLRIHTRLPVVLPKRITCALKSMLSKTRLKPVIVIHANTPYEVDKEVISTLKALKNITILNQSVLLKDVNDNEQDLVSLGHRLFISGTIPYYIHLLDKVKGVSHFHVEQCVGESLVYGISKKMSGYLVPRLTKEIPYLDSKFTFC